MDDTDSTKKQTHFKNVGDVQYIVRTNTASINKVSSTASLKRSIHSSNSSETGSLKNKLARIRNEGLVASSSVISVKKHLRTSITKEPTQPQADPVILNSRSFSIMENDQEYTDISKRRFRDEADILSRQPSYTLKKVSYNLECKQRYQKAWNKYNAQLTREMTQMVSLKQRVAEQYYTRCFLSYTTFWPPLHTQNELDIFKRHFLKLPPAQQKRLNYLMATDLSYA